MPYKHGVYGEQIPYSGPTEVISSGSVPVYIGTAPIQQINTEGSDSYDYSGLINTPILITSLADAKAKIGYSDAWDKYTLGEAIKAHFDNGAAAVGPIIVINMANPATKEGTDQTPSVTLSGVTGNKVGYISDPQAAIENVAITSTTPITASDYTLTYEDDKIKITIIKSGYADANCTATYERIDVSDTALTAAGAFASAIAALDLCEAKTGVIPTLLVAPGYSEKTAYHDAMLAKAVAKISQKWYICCVSDIISDSTADTVTEVIDLKPGSNYNSKLDKVCWPMVKLNGKIYHLSTIATVTMQQQDALADGAPYVSPSNKSINATSVVVKAGTPIVFDEVTANSLNQIGITTVNLVKGSLRLWGPHMGNYSYTNVANILPEDKTDSSVRMMQYLLNTLQYSFLDTVDKPIAKRDVDSIKASVQQWLNGLVSEGKLLYGTIDFVAASNLASDIAEGDFVFNVSTTTTPNAKSLTFKVQYTTAGIAALTGGAN